MTNYLLSTYTVSHCSGHGDTVENERPKELRVYVLVGTIQKTGNNKVKNNSYQMMIVLWRKLSREENKKLSIETERTSEQRLKSK